MEKVGDRNAQLISNNGSMDFFIRGFLTGICSSKQEVGSNDRVTLTDAVTN
jgi:hypothetical protein